LAGGASLLPLPTSLTPAQALQRAPVLLQRGRLAEAERLYDFVLKADRNNFAALHNLAVVRMQQERYEDAVTLLRKALNRNPNVAEALNNLGNALQKLGRLPEAVVRYEKALALQPDDANFHRNLGIALKSLGRHADAIVHIEKALAPDPADVTARYRLATAMLEHNYYERAVEHLEKLLAVQPDFVPALKRLGQAFEELGRITEARELYQRVIALKPDDAEAFCALGLMLEIEGRAEEAREAFEKAIAHDPDRPFYYHALANAKRLRRGDPHLAAMDALAATMESRPANDQMLLHFALGKVMEDNGEYERSMRHLFEGNAIKRRTISYDEAATRQSFEQTRSFVSPTLMREMAGRGDPSSVPIFILGMPRSGTTLVEQILASHPGVFGAGERREFLDALPRYLPGFPRPTMADMGHAMRDLGADYVARLTAIAPTAARITDKRPSNFRFAGLIHLALPNARIIHTRRDPLDTCISIFSKLFSGDQPFAYDLGELGHYYRMYERLMEHWRSVLPPGVMLDVRYEDVVADLEGQARRIVAHCGLGWDEACLAFHKTARPVQTASKNQVRQPIYTSSVGRSRLYGKALAPLMEALEMELPTVTA
jgi:tetratricopeptide (TPR) repeat protein